MIATPDWERFKDLIVATTYLSRPALHVFTGLALFLVVLALLGTRRGMIPAWSVVLVVELANEALDLVHANAVGASLDLMPGWYDIADTIALPTLVVMWTAILTDAAFGYRRRQAGQGRPPAPRALYQPAKTARAASRRT